MPASCRVFACIALVAFAWPCAGLAQRQALGGYTARRMVADGRAVLKVRRIRLPWTAHERPWESAKTRRVEVREDPKRIVRQMRSDGPIENGSFTRTIRTLTIERNTPLLRVLDESPKWTPRQSPFLFSSKRLGVHFEAREAQIRLFAPDAQGVFLVLDKSGERVQLLADRSGVWEATLRKPPRELFGQSYHFELLRAGARHRIADPYGHLADPGRIDTSIFVDPTFAWSDASFRAPTTEQLVVSEAHAKDLSAHASSRVSPEDRGTYRGLGSDAVTQHFGKLGTALELLPLHESDPAQGGHWGYMTRHYMAPTRRFERDPGKAPQELKRAINRLHRARVPVIMDVVFNHTANDEGLAFRVLGRSTFYRVDGNGRDHNGAGVGNEFASESPMARRLIVDSLRHFASEYHVDGFRMDLGALLDVKTMREIDRALPRRIHLFAEPWAADHARARWGKGDMRGALKNTRWAVWNDDFREPALRFLTGNSTRDDRNRLMTAIAGSASPFGWADRPSQSVNYVESHDEYALAHRMGSSARRQFLAAVLLLTARGIPMLAHGQEFLRDKKGWANSYDQDNDVNWTDWKLAEENRALLTAHQKLIALRKAAPALHDSTRLTERNVTWMLPDNPRALGYLLRARTGKPMLILLNSDAHERVRFSLPHGSWNVIADGETLQVDASGLRLAERDYHVAPHTAVILSQ